MVARQLLLDNNTTVRIDSDKDQLGSGRAGAVYKAGNLAIKVWFKPDPDQIEKVRLLLPKYRLLPPGAVAPLGFVRRDSGAEVRGVYMGLLPDNVNQLGVLFNPRLRLRHGLNLSQTLDVLLSLRGLLIASHEQHLLWVDFNRSNAYFTPAGQTFVIDVDNWWIENRRFGDSVIFTPEFAAPALREMIKQKQPFTPTREHEWTSFAIMLVNALLGVNPYDGVHDRFLTQEELAINRKWLFDPKVGYPTNGAPREIIAATPLYDTLKRYVVDGSIAAPFPDTVIRQYQGLLTGCQQCGREYPGTIGYCPFCQPKPYTAPLADAFQIVSLLRSPIPLVHVVWQAGNLHAVGYNRRTYQYFKVDPQGKTDSQPLPQNITPGARFALVGSSHLAVHFDSQRIDLFDLSASGWSGTTTSQRFLGNRQLAFRGTAQGLFRLSMGKLLQGTPFHDTLLEEEVPVDPLENQTWFWADPNRPVQLVLIQLGLQQLYSLIYRGLRHEVTLPQLDTGESLVATAVSFADASCLIIRLTETAAQETRRWSVIDYDTRSVRSGTSDITGQVMPNIHSYGFSDAEGHPFLWVPTDAGLVREELTSGSVQTILQSKQHVTAADHITYLGHRQKKYHFLVYDQQHIRYLVI